MRKAANAPRQKPSTAILHLEIAADMDADLERHRARLSAQVGAPLSRSAAARVLIRRGVEALASADAPRRLSVLDADLSA